MRLFSKTGLVLAMCASFSGCSGGSPEQLVTNLQTALKSGDVDAAVALLDSPNIPSEQKFYFVDTVYECTYKMTCATKTVPLDEAFNKRIATQKEQQGVELTGTPEGLIQIDESGEGMKGSFKMPYGKVNGSYKILSAHLSAAKLAELRAQTAQSKTDAFLKTGVGTSPDADWQSHATVLMFDGHDGNGWVVRGYQVMKHHGDKWTTDAGDVVATPDA